MLKLLRMVIVEMEDFFFQIQATNVRDASKNTVHLIHLKSFADQMNKLTNNFINWLHFHRPLFLIAESLMSELCENYILSE